MNYKIKILRFVETVLYRLPLQSRTRDLCLAKTFDWKITIIDKEVGSKPDGAW